MIHLINLIENYIYFYHIQKFCVIPQWPDNISDSISASFSSTNILGRSAPIYTYSNSGPRTVSFNFKLHRDMMTNINITPNSFGLENNSQIVEELVRTIQTVALPKYTQVTKVINPPIVAVRIGDEIYVKGVVKGGVSINYSGPIIDNKYSVCDISFSVEEMDPYDAEGVASVGSFRGLNKSLERRIKSGGNYIGN